MKKAIRREPHALLPIPHVEGPDYDALDDLLGFSLRRAQIAMFVSFNEATHGLDITPARFTALLIVGANPGIRQTVVGKILGIARSGVNALADWMEQRGLAERRADKHDARAWGLYLTSRGLALVEEMKRRIVEAERKRSAALTPGERKELLRLLRKLAG